MVAIAVTLSGCAGPLSILDPAGKSAHSSAWLWWGMFGLLGVIMLVVFALWFIALKRTPDQAQPSPSRASAWVIGGGLVLPLSSIVLILAFGIPLGQQMLPFPLAEGQPVKVEVVGHRWWWEVRYPGTGIELRDELHIPAATPVDLHLSSEDVVHSFWVPRLGRKLDMIPGHTNVLRLEADEPGRYRGQCAEFCGRGHAHMGFVVIAHNEEDWKAWLEEAAND